MYLQLAQIHIAVDIERDRKEKKYILYTRRAENLYISNDIRGRVTYRFFLFIHRCALLVCVEKFSVCTQPIFLERTLFPRLVVRNIVYSDATSLPFFARKLDTSQIKWRTIFQMKNTIFSANGRHSWN